MNDTAIDFFFINFLSFTFRYFLSSANISISGIFCKETALALKMKKKRKIECLFIFFKKLFIFNICQQSNQAFLMIVLPLSSDDYSEEGEYEPDPQSEVHVQNDHRQESHHPDDLDSLN